MLKNIFKKATPPESSLASRADDLLKIYVQRYCLERHIRLKVLMDKMERDIIFQVLEAAHGSQRTAAQMLGVKPNTLHYKIRRMGIVPVREYQVLDGLFELTSSSDRTRQPGRKAARSNPSNH